MLKEVYCSSVPFCAVHVTYHASSRLLNADINLKGFSKANREARGPSLILELIKVAEGSLGFEDFPTQLGVQKNWEQILHLRGSITM